MIPIEEQSEKFILYLILIVIPLALLIYADVKLCDCYRTHLEDKKERLFRQTYVIDFRRLQAQMT